MRPVATLLLLSSLGLALQAEDSAAPATASSTSTPTAKSAAGKSKGDVRDRIAQLKAGLSTKEAAKLLGAPERRVRKKETPVGPVEAWIYHSRYTAGSRHVQTGSTSYQRPNPITNVMETVTEPIMGVENTFVTEEHVLVFKDGGLIEWKTLVTDRSMTTS